MKSALGRKTVKLLWACSLISAAALAHADWDRVVGNDYVIAFRDNCTVGTEGPYIKVWTLWSYSEPQDDDRGRHAVIAPLPYDGALNTRAAESNALNPPLDVAWQARLGPSPAGNFC